METAQLQERKVKVNNNSLANQKKAITPEVESKEQPIQNNTAQKDKDTSDSNDFQKVNYVVKGPIYNPSSKEDNEHSEKKDTNKTVVNVNIQSVRGSYNSSVIQSTSQGVENPSVNINETSNLVQDTTISDLDPEPIERTTDHINFLGIMQKVFPF